MSDPTPTPAPANPSSFKSLTDDIKTAALGALVMLVIIMQMGKLPLPNPAPNPPTPVPIPVPVPPTPNPIPTPIPPAPTPTPAPVVADFFSLGKAYKQALGAAYADAWDANFQIQPGDDLDKKLAAIKSQWDAARSASFGATVAPELEKLAPNHQSVDQPTADALNKARADFTRGLRNAG
jgi:hypothetical protein